MREKTLEPSQSRCCHPKGGTAGISVLKHQKNTQHNRSQPQKAGPESAYQEITENGRRDDGLIRFLILSKVREVSNMVTPCATQSGG